MNININDREIELRYTFRAHILYENITGETFTPGGLSSIINFFYATIMATDRDSTLDYEEFLDWLDENAEKLKEFATWLTKNIQKDEVLMEDKKDTENQKKVKKKD